LQKIDQYSIGQQKFSVFQTLQNTRVLTGQLNLTELSSLKLVSSKTNFSQNIPWQVMSFLKVKSTVCGSGSALKNCVAVPDPDVIQTFFQIAIYEKNTSKKISHFLRKCAVLSIPDRDFVFFTTESISALN
jgi:hypothetical protein